MTASLVTQMLVAERYGLRLGTAQLAEVLGLAEGTVRNRISARTLGVPTYEDGGRRWADYRDVAEYLDKQREMDSEQAWICYIHEAPKLESYEAIGDVLAMALNFRSQSKPTSDRLYSLFDVGAAIYAERFGTEWVPF